MTEREQIEHFADELDKLVQRFRGEYELTYASITGCLNMKIFTLHREVEKMHEEE